MTPAYCESHLAVGTHRLHAGDVAHLELVDEREVHAAHEAHLLRLADERRDGADEEGALLLAKLERGEIGGRLDDPPVLVGREGIVDAGEVRVRIFLGELREVVGEDEADADDDVHAFGGEQAQPRLAIGAFTRLDEADADAELLLGALGTEIGAVVERLVAATAQVEHDADVHRVARGRLGGTGWMNEQKDNVDAEQHGHEDEQLLHRGGKVVRGAGRGKNRMTG